MKPEIIPTVVPQSLEDVVGAQERYSPLTPSLHIDIVDGVFAPNKTWTPMPAEKLPDLSTAFYEAHLMVTNPLQTGLTLTRAGAARIIGHVEAFDNAESAREAFDMWQTAGAKEVGVAILFNTPLEELASYMQLCDFVHMMTIAKVGKQGAAFEPRSLERVAAVHARYPHVVISVDGGETKENVDDLARAGASRFCIGSALAKSKDPAKEYEKLLQAAKV